MHGRNVLVADEAGAFAQHVVQLHRDPELCNRLSRNEIQTIREHFSTAAATRDVQDLLSHLN
jgi:glycosyltransferase involved in cell wall biosynthesis